MILTYNYKDLQDIKAQIIKDKLTDNEEIYYYIEAYKDTINFMFQKNLVVDFTKKDFEEDLQDFARTLLANTNMSYEQLERQYKYQITKNYYTSPNEIKLKL